MVIHREEGAKPLAGVRVLTVEQYIAGPYCTMLLADAGAEIIKIEKPPYGDPRRTIGPFLETDGGEKISGGFLGYNRSKKSVMLNLAHARGRDIFRSLAKKVDVVVDNLRPGAMERQGLGYNDLSADNRRLVYSSISGFGQMEGYRGPYWERPALDVVAEAMGGVMHMVGFADKPPVSALYGMADLYAGLINAYGIMLALFQREQTGRGQYVDTSMYDGMLALNERAITFHGLTGEVPSRGRERVLGPRGAFRARDGYVAFNIPTETMWAQFALLIEREDLIADPRTENGPARAAHGEFVRSIIEEWLAPRTRDEAVEQLIAAGIPAGPVQTAEDIARCPQVRARKMLVRTQQPGIDAVNLVRSPVLMSESPEVKTAPAPALGEHTHEVLRQLLHMGQEDLHELKELDVL